MSWVIFILSLGLCQIYILMECITYIIIPCHIYSYFERPSVAINFFFMEGIIYIYIYIYIYYHLSSWIRPYYHVIYIVILKDQVSQVIFLMEAIA